MLQRNRHAFAVMLCCLASSVWAQATNPDEYSKNIAHHSAVSTLTDTFAGDHIDLSSGRLEIIQTDVDLPGKNTLPMRVGRRFETADVYSEGHFGIWTLDIPSVHGTFSDYGWQAGDATTNRCSSYGAPPTVSNQGGWWDPNEYWHGTFFYLPGSGDQELLQFAGSQRAPNDGLAYHAMTKEGAVVRCVALASTSVSGVQGGGEGFEVVTKDGVVYTLNQMVTRNQKSLSKSTAGPVFGIANTSARNAKKQSLVVQPQVSMNYVLPRDDYFLFPTKVADRFGNTVLYNWSATNPWQLLSMVGSDGRHLDFTYTAADSKTVATVSDGTRTWHYAYGVAVGTNDYADIVTLPDNTNWTYRLGLLHTMSVSPTSSWCDTMNGMTARTTDADASNTSPRSGSITGPSGATVTFNVGRVLLGRSHLYFNCVSYDGDPTHARPNNPYLFLTAAVVSKTITGPGLPTNGLTWSYSYGPSNNCWDGTLNSSEGIACTSASPTTRLVVATGPDSVKTRYTFGNRVNVNEGLLLKTEYGWDGTQAKRTVQIDYADQGSAPYGAYDGWSPRGYGDFEMTGMVHPQRKITTTQQGRTFTWAVASDCSGVPYCFDSYARPTKVVKSSAPSP